MRFADDVLLLASSKEQLQQMLCDFRRSTEKIGLKIHPGKTKILSNQSSKKMKKLKKNWRRKNSKMQHQLRPAQDTSEEIRKIQDPELPDELLIQNFVMNYQMCKKQM